MNGGADGQLALLSPAAPPVPDWCDLRCCGVAELLADLATKGERPCVIWSDSPWSYSAGIPGHGRMGEHYDGLSVAQIAEHHAAVYDVAGDDCYLAMWATWPFIRQALLEVAGPWEFLSGGCWAKTGQVGTGYHWRSQSEPLLLHRKGKPRPWRMAPVLRGAHIEHREWNGDVRHSEKPVEWMADCVAAWCPPGGLVLDLYAGLGSVARAVRRAGEGRRYVGAEIDPERHAGALALLAQKGAS